MAIRFSIRILCLSKPSWDNRLVNLSIWDSLISLTSSTVDISFLLPSEALTHEKEKLVLMQINLFHFALHRCFKLSLIIPISRNISVSPRIVLYLLSRVFELNRENRNMIQVGLYCFTNQKGKSSSKFASNFLIFSCNRGQIAHNDSPFAFVGQIWKIDLVLI